MEYTLPHTVESGDGEKIIFKEIIHEPGGDKVIVESFCEPGCGPAMHVHFKQDECLTVVSGQLSYQILGKEPVHVNTGETITFLRNQPHKFWNTGDGELKIEGWVKPVNSVIFFLSALFEARKRSGKSRPELFDGAYLMTRYKNEYGMPEIPGFVKNVIMPATYQLGKVLGKYEKFKDAPEPL